MSATTHEIDSVEAARHMASYQERLKRARKTPTLSPAIQDLSDRTKQYIHNVGPWRHERMLGSWGTFIVPACQPGESHASMAAIPGIFTEPVPISEKRNRLDEYEGKYVAEQILGIGPHLQKNQALTRFGCFMSLNAVPTKAELATAGAELQKEYLRLFKEAQDAYNKGPKEFENTVTDRHRQSAVALNREDAEWMKQYAPQGQQKCPMCGTSSDPGVVMCARCEYIFDEARYEELSKRTAKGRRTSK